MIIGAPTSTSLQYSVSRSRQPVRLSRLMEKDRGRGRWQVSLLARITILIKYYCLSLCNFPSIPANDLRIGRTSPFVPERTRRFTRDILSNDGRTDGEDRGQGY